MCFGEVINTPPANPQNYSVQALYDRMNKHHYFEEVQIYFGVQRDRWKSEFRERVWFAMTYLLFYFSLLLFSFSFLARNSNMETLRQKKVTVVVMVILDTS